MKKVTAAFILTVFISLSSCSEEYDNYIVSVHNGYFETLYNTRIGKIKFDTLFIDKSTPEVSVTRGRHSFSAETESGLVLTTIIDLKGSEQWVKLHVDEQGRLLNK